MKNVYTVLIAIIILGGIVYLARNFMENYRYDFTFSSQYYPTDTRKVLNCLSFKDQECLYSYKQLARNMSPTSLSTNELKDGCNFGLQYLNKFDSPMIGYNKYINRLDLFKKAGFNRNDNIITCTYKDIPPLFKYTLDNTSKIKEICNSDGSLTQTFRYNNCDSTKYDCPSTPKPADFEKIVKDANCSPAPWTITQDYSPCDYNPDGFVGQIFNCYKQGKCDKSPKPTIAPTLCKGLA
jgi:hypothetical protein